MLSVDKIQVLWRFIHAFPVNLKVAVTKKLWPIKKIVSLCLGLFTFYFIEMSEQHRQRIEMG